MSAELLSHGIIYLFSLTGLLLTPHSLNKLRWVFPLWFGIINILLFSGIWKFNIFNVPAYFILMTQVPWVLITAYIITSVNLKIISISLCEWTLWGMFHLIGIHYLFWLHGAALPQNYILITFILEAGVGISAIPLYFILKHRPKLGWYALIFWNSLGMLSGWRINSIFQRILWEGPANSSQREIFSYYSSFPELWLICFWIPLSLCVHIILFYGLWKHRKKSF